jgi:hypothetical protein
VIHPFAAVATGAGFTSPDSPGADALSEAGRDDALRPATPAYSGTSSTRGAPASPRRSPALSQRSRPLSLAPRVTAAKPLDPAGTDHYRSPPRHPGMRPGAVSCQPSERPLDVLAGSDRRRIPRSLPQGGVQGVQRAGAPGSARKCPAPACSSLLIRTLRLLARPVLTSGARVPVLVKDIAWSVESGMARRRPDSPRNFRAT